jgi:hypothetical protein
MSATYTVTADSNDLAGWTAETLAAALEAPLAEIGVTVECKPRQFGGGGLTNDEADSVNPDLVQSIVERVVTDGPA